MGARRCGGDRHGCGWNSLPNNRVRSRRPRPGGHKGRPYGHNPISRSTPRKRNLFLASIRRARGPRGELQIEEGTHKGCPYVAAILPANLRMAAAASSTSGSLMSR